MLARIRSWKELCYADAAASHLSTFLGSMGCRTSKIASETHGRQIIVSVYEVDDSGSLENLLSLVSDLGVKERVRRVKKNVPILWPEPCDLWPYDCPAYGNPLPNRRKEKRKAKAEAVKNRARALGAAAEVTRRFYAEEELWSLETVELERGSKKHEVRRAGVVKYAAFDRQQAFKALTELSTYAAVKAASGQS